MSDTGSRPEPARGALDKFDRLARGYSSHDYADPSRYTARRARVATGLGPPLAPGATVLDLACADANMAEPLLALGYRYRGVDGSAGMIDEARKRLGDRVPLDVALMDEYEPPEPVDMTLCLRAFYYPADRVAFLRRVAGYTTTKVVFDFNPRALAAAGIERDLRAAGLELTARRAYLLPQSIRLPGAAASAVRAIERVEPLAALVLRARGQWLYAAVPASR